MSGRWGTHNDERDLMARRERIDMVGVRCGRLVGLAHVETGRPHAHWLFQCDCGATTIADGAAVRHGKTSSCGCLHREICAARLTTHGHRAARRHGPTYRAWQEIKTYCTNPASPRYRDFGARGVTVDPGWAGDYTAFLAAMGERPPGMMLARRDPDGPFAPDNCHWVQVRSRAERAGGAPTAATPTPPAKPAQPRMPGRLSPFSRAQSIAMS